MFAQLQHSVVDVIKLFGGNLDSPVTRIAKNLKEKLTVVEYIFAFHIFVHIQTSKQICFNVLILSKSTLPPPQKKNLIYNIDHWLNDFRILKCELQCR